MNVIAFPKRHAYPHAVYGPFNPEADILLDSAIAAVAAQDFSLERHRFARLGFLFTTTTEETVEWEGGTSFQVYIGDMFMTKVEADILKTSHPCDHAEFVRHVAENPVTHAREAIAIANQRIREW